VASTARALEQKGSKQTGIRRQSLKPSVVVHRKVVEDTGGKLSYVSRCRRPVPVPERVNYGVHLLAGSDAGSTSSESAQPW